MVTGGLVEEVVEEEEEFQVLQEQFWPEVAAAMIFPCSLVASMNILLTLLVAMAESDHWLSHSAVSQLSFNLLNTARHRGPMQPSPW